MSIEFHLTCLCYRYFSSVNILFEYCRVNEALMYGVFMLSQSLLLSPNYKSTKTCGARILHLINRDPQVKTESGIRDKQDWVCMYTHHSRYHPHLDRGLLTHLSNCSALIFSSSPLVGNQPIFFRSPVTALIIYHFIMVFIHTRQSRLMTSLSPHWYCCILSF